MRVSSILAITLLSMVSSTGCFTAAKQALAEVRGAQASVEPISTAARGSAAAVHFRPARTEAGGAAVASAAAAFDAAARQVEQEINAGAGTGDAVEVDTKILYFRERGLFGTGLLLAHVQAMQRSGSPVLDAFVRVETKSFRAGDLADMAEAMAKDTARFLTGRSREILDLDKRKDSD